MMEIIFSFVLTLHKVLTETFYSWWQTCVLLAVGLVQAHIYLSFKFTVLLSQCILAGGTPFRMIESTFKCLLPLWNMLQMGWQLRLKWGQIDVCRWKSYLYGVLLTSDGMMWTTTLNHVPRVWFQMRLWLIQEVLEYGVQTALAHFKSNGEKWHRRKPSFDMLHYTWEL